jgi:hypothetical protein
MAEKFDPYHKWLGIPPEEQPPHHYRLLGIGLFESDPDVIEGAADRQMSHVQTHKTGPNSAASQKLLNELSAAKLCLLNAKKKAAYDEDLKAKLAAAAPVVPVAQAIAEDEESLAAGLMPGVVAVDGPTPGRTSFSVQQARQRKQRNAMIVAGLGVAVVAIVAVGAWKVLTDNDEPAVASSNGSNAGQQPAQGGADSNSKDNSPSASGSSTNTTGGERVAERGPNTEKLDDKRPANDGGGPTNGQTNRTNGEGGRNTPATSGQPATNRQPETTGPINLDGPVDLLKLVDLKRDQVAGQWKLENGKLIAPVGRFSRMRIGLDPPEEYRFTAVVKRTSGQESFNMGLIWGGRPIMAVIDGWGGSVSALEMIGGRRGDANPTTKRGKSYLASPVPHTLTCTVRKGGIRVDCDGVMVIDHRGTPPGASLVPDWSVGTPPKLFIGCWMGSYEITRLELAPITPADNRVATAETPEMPNDKPGDDQPEDSEPDDNERGNLASIVDGPKKKTPVPDSQAIEAARATIAKTFADEIKGAKTDEQKADLANTLFRTGIDPAEELPIRYVLLDMAREYAVDAASTEIALNSIDELARQFAVDPLQLKAEALTATLKKPQPTTDHQALAQMLLELTDQAISAASFETADKLAGLAKTEAVRSKDDELRKSATEKDKQVQRLLKEQEAMTKATAILTDSPDDPAANLAIGRFYCFLRDDWEEGVKHLFKSGHDTLTKLAELELSEPEESADQIALADAWWDGAASAPAADKEFYRIRARYWYLQALPGLVGVNKTRAEERLEEGDSASASAATTTGGSSGSGSAAIDSLLKRLDVAFKKQRLDRTAVVGRGRTEDAFADMPPNNAAGLLIGFNVTLRQRNNNRYIGSIQPIFLTADGERSGPVHGRRDRDPVVAVKAPEGYAVAGVLVKGNNQYRIDGLVVNFAKITPTGLSRKDTQTSTEHGVTGGGQVLAAPVGKPVVGIYGSSDDFDPDALGLIFAQ